MSTKTGVFVVSGETFFTHNFTNNGGGITASVEIAQDRRSCVVGVSFSNPHDAWDRKKGNKIADGRRKSFRNYATKLNLPENATTEDVQKALVDHLCKLNKDGALWNDNHTKEVLPRWLCDLDVMEGLKVDILLQSQRWNGSKMSMH